MTDNQKEFFRKLADLMDEHGVEEIELTEDYIEYGGCLQRGLEFTFFELHEDGLKRHDCREIEGRCLYPKNFRDVGD